MNATSTIVQTYDTVCDALRDVHDEASLWKLSDELVKVAPAGVAAVETVVAQAKVRGIPTKSANTLRLYRDVAIRFPASERVANVTFSAHREAIVIGDSKAARKLLEELAKQHGAEGVSVTTVKQAIGAATGKVTKPATGKAAGKGTSYSEVALDLCKANGKKFIAELDAMLTIADVTLDGLHVGLSAVPTEVETRRAKAARKAQIAKGHRRQSGEVPGGSQGNRRGSQRRGERQGSVVRQGGSGEGRRRQGQGRSAQPLIDAYQGASDGPLVATNDGFDSRTRTPATMPVSNKELGGSQTCQLSFQQR
jgi:hypothetical protein